MERDDDEGNACRTDFVPNLTLDRQLLLRYRISSIFLDFPSCTYPFGKEIHMLQHDEGFIYLVRDPECKEHLAHISSVPFGGAAREPSFQYQRLANHAWHAPQIRGGRRLHLMYAYRR